MEDRLLTVKQLTHFIPLAEQTIYHMLSRHRKGIESFPVPITRLGRKPYFRLSDVQQWIKDYEDPEEALRELLEIFKVEKP